MKMTAAMIAKPIREHDCEDPPALALLDLTERGREGRDHLAEDQHRHAVADAAFGDQLTEPHDHCGAGGHRDHHHEEGLGAVVVQQRQLALEEAAGARQGHDAGGLQQRKAQGQVARVLGDLRLAGLALLLQRLEPRDHHDEKLQDDAGRDVGHDAQREDGQLEQGATGEQVDQAVEPGIVAVLSEVDTGPHVGHVDAGSRNLRSSPEDEDDEQDEQQLAPQVGSPEGVHERAEHEFLFLQRIVGPQIRQTLTGALRSVRGVAGGFMTKPSGTRPTYQRFRERWSFRLRPRSSPWRNRRTH